MIQNTPIDLTLLPAPDVLEPLDYESILAAMLADLRARYQAFDALVESDPAYKLLEVCAYRELLLRHRINDAARAVMMAYAQGNDLDQLAGNYGVARLLITPADDTANPPTPAVYEDDDAFRARVLLSLEGYTTAGSRGSYQFHALSASSDVLDVGVTSLEPGTVNIAILSRTGAGSAPAATIASVTAALNAETIRPLCDTVQVASAVIVPYDVSASLRVYAGIDQAAVVAAATSALQGYASAQHRLGLGVSRSGIFAALHRSGVVGVTLSQPSSDIHCAWNEAAALGTVTLTTELQ